MTYDRLVEVVDEIPSMKNVRAVEETRTPSMIVARVRELEIEELKKDHEFAKAVRALNLATPHDRRVLQYYLHNYLHTVLARLDTSRDRKKMDSPLYLSTELLKKADRIQQEEPSMKGDDSVWAVKLNG